MPKPFGHGSEGKINSDVKIVLLEQSKKLWHSKLDFQNIDWEFRSLGHKVQL